MLCDLPMCEKNFVSIFYYCGSSHINDYGLIIIKSENSKSDLVTHYFLLRESGVNFALMNDHFCGFDLFLFNSLELLFRLKKKHIHLGFIHYQKFHWFSKKR